MADDDGFIDYVSTTVDPGPWLNVATAAFCALSVVLFPCMVSLGRRYEKRRMRERRDEVIGEIEIEDEKVELMEAPLESFAVSEPSGKTKRRRKKRGQPGSGSSSSYHSSLSSSDSPLPASRSDVFDNSNGLPALSETERPKTRSEPIVCDGVLGMPGAPIGNNKAERQMQLLIDRLVMPPYPDDGDGPDIDMARNSSDATSENKNVTLLDTGAAKRNRHAGARRYRRGQRDTKWKAELEEERRLSSIARGEVRDGESSSSSDEHSSENHPAVSLPSSSVTSISQSPSSGDEHSTEKEPSMNLPSSSVRSISQVDDSDTIERSFRRVSHHPSTASGSNGGALEDCLPDGPVVEIERRANGPLESKVSMEGEELDLCCGSHAWWKPVTIASAFDGLLDIVEWDREMKRILNLSVPFSISAVVAGTFGVLRVSLVANYLGSDAVGAYTIVGLILALVEECFGGFALSVASLSSQAIGRHNCKLAGEYVQISCILFTLCMIPNILVWMFFTDDVVRLFGFNERTVQMAQVYARFRIVGLWFEGLDEAYGSFLEVINHERFTMSLDIVNELFSTVLILSDCLTGQATLRDVGVIEMTTDGIFLGFSFVLSYLAGWMKNYTNGMFRTNGMRNKVAVRTVVKTAIPLGLGQLLQYGEWEILTVFVARLGPAEVTAWGIIAAIWDTLESLTEGFGDAGEIRVAYHLGAEQPAKARLSSYKSLLVSVICATIVTSIMWICGESLATWLTPDPTLQHLIVEVLPLMGIGNLALTSGTVSWALVGGQGRYRLATFVAFVCSWCVTLPLAAIFTYALHIDLQGVTSAVVIGNSVTGTCLMYILCTSDWERISKLIVERSSDESEESDSSSSSSSSSSSKETEKCISKLSVERTSEFNEESDSSSSSSSSPPSKETEFFA